MAIGIYMAKKILIKIYIICMFATVFASCEKAYIQFGDSFIDQNLTNIIMVDTVAPVISTLFIDSVITSNTGTVLVGNYSDPLFGNISAASFFVMGHPSNTATLHQSAVYDSLSLILIGDSTFYGDTSLPLRIKVEQLSERILFNDNESYLYDRSNFTVMPTALATTSFLIRPSEKDTFNIRLSDRMGLEFWNHIINKTTEVNSDTDFEYYFKGLKLSSATDDVNAAIFGFSDTVIMRLHYHELNPDIAEKQLDFMLVNRNKQFNQIKVNRSGTILHKSIPESKEILSSDLGGAAYIQRLTGAIMKMRFPSLRSAILERRDYQQLMKAELTFKPVGNSYNKFFMLPPQLVAYTTNKNNVQGSAIGLLGNPGGSNTQYGNLVTDWLYGQDTYYSYDLTTYIQQQLLTEGDNDNALLFMPPSPADNIQLNRIAVADSKNSEGKMILKLYFISVQQD